jgi:hypothetical protein
MSAFITALGRRQNGGAVVAAVLTAGQPQFADYRARAAECQRVADRQDELIKRQYEELARQWLVLAEQAEQQFR